VMGLTLLLCCGMDRRFPGVIDWRG